MKKRPKTSKAWAQLTLPGVTHGVLSERAPFGWNRKRGPKGSVQERYSCGNSIQGKLGGSKDNPRNFADNRIKGKKSKNHSNCDHNNR